MNSFFPRIAAFLVFIIIFVCAFYFIKGCEERKVSKEVDTLLSNGAVILDVRTPEEYSQGHIDGSINIELNQLYGEDLDSLGLDKRYTYITCCAKGGRSIKAAETLNSRGYRAYNGGSWKGLRKRIK